MDFNPAEIDFEKVRHYPADELTVEQMEIIKTNSDKLNDEEKGAFSYIIEDEEFIADDAENDDENTDKGSGTQTKDDAATDDDAGDDAGVPQFKTKAEIDKYVAEQTAKALEEAKSKNNGSTIETTPEDKKFVSPLDDPNWKAPNAKALADAIEERNVHRAAEAAAEANKQRVATDKRLHAELDQLAATGKIPAKTTDEGKKVVDQMAHIAEKRGYKTFTEAYEEWSKTPVEFGGGYDPANAAAARETAQKKAQLNKQKAAASKVSAGKGEPPSGKAKPLSYEKLKSMHIDDITDFALGQYNK